jgi:hypothetical protein
MAYTHFGELEIKPIPNTSSPFQLMAYYTHFGKLEIKPTSIPLPIPNHGIHIPLWWNTNLPPPTHLYLWEFVFGEWLPKLHSTWEFEEFKRVGSQRGNMGVLGCVHMWKEGGQSFCCGSLQPWCLGGGGEGSLPLNLLTIQGWLDAWWVH